MKSQAYRLCLPTGCAIATANVIEDEGRLFGSFAWTNPPADVKQALSEFGEIVENQILSLLDAIEEKIVAFDIRAVRQGDEAEYRTVNLHAYPSDNTIDFLLGDRVESYSQGLTTRSTELGLQPAWERSA